MWATPSLYRRPIQYVVRRSAPSRPMKRSVPRFSLHQRDSPFDFFSNFAAIDRHFEQIANNWESNFFPMIDGLASEAKAINNKESKKIEAAPSTAAADAPTSTNAIATPHSDSLSFFSNKSSFGSVTRKETDDGMQYAVALPGLQLEDVKLDFDLKNRFLTLSAEKKTETKNEENGASFFRHVSFKRQLPIPVSTDSASAIKPENITADLENGVLTISIAHKKAIEDSSVSAATAGAATAAATETVAMEADEPKLAPIVVNAASSATETASTVADSKDAAATASTPASTSNASPNDVSVEDAEDEH